MKERRHYNKAKPSVKTCRVPPVWRRGETKKALWQDQPPSKPSRVSSAWLGGRDKRRKPTRNGKVAQPTVPRGGGCLAENAYQKRKQTNVHHKDKRTKHTVLCHCVCSQITLAAPRLGADGGVGRTTKNGHEKPTVPCLCVATRLPKPWSRTEWGGRRDGRKADRREKRDHPGPALSEGSVGQEKNKTHEPSGPAQSRKRHSKP